MLSESWDRHHFAKNCEADVDRSKLWRIVETKYEEFECVGVCSNASAGEENRLIIKTKCLPHIKEKTNWTQKDGIAPILEHFLLISKQTPNALASTDF